MNFSHDAENTPATSINTDQLKTDVVTHANDENTPADDVLDQKITEITSTNGEKSNAVVRNFIVGYERRLL